VCTAAGWRNKLLHQILFTMPKSKRNKVVSLSKTTKKGFELKKDLVSQIQACCDEFASLYIFSVEDMRNQKLKGVRQHWRTSRFFFGKNKVMTIALGRTKEDEYKENLHKVSEQLSGNVGLMFTNEQDQKVKEWFSSFTEPDYARSGNKATKTITLPAGPLDENSYPHNMEPALRSLSLPTELKKGIIHLTTDYTVCKKDEVLSPEQCRVLKLFFEQLASFHLVLKSLWTSHGKFTVLEDVEDEDE